MPRICLEDRDPAVDFIISGTHLQKIRFFVILEFLIIFLHRKVYAQNDFHNEIHYARMFRSHHKSFQQLWQTYLATGSAADLAQRPERRVITTRQDIIIELSYIRQRFVIARYMSQTFF